MRSLRETRERAVAGTPTCRGQEKETAEHPAGGRGRQGCGTASRSKCSGWPGLSQLCWKLLEGGTE